MKNISNKECLLVNGGGFKDWYENTCDLAADCWDKGLKECFFGKKEGNAEL